MSVQVPEPILSWFHALVLPPEALVGLRIARTAFDRFSLSESQLRLLKLGLEEMFWLAALKERHVAIPVLREGGRGYLEVAVLALVLTPKASPAACCSLLHRLIPYPMILFWLQRDDVGISLAHKRPAEREGVLSTLEPEGALQVLLPSSGPLVQPMREALSWARQSQRHLEDLYHDYLVRAQSLAIAARTQTLVFPSSYTLAHTRWSCYLSLLDLEDQLQRARTQARAQTQLGSRLEHSHRLRALKQERDRMLALLLNHDQV